jgi:hypothetical protein
MNEFVNFKKRGVTLPPGCKDLIDLLRPAAKATIASEYRVTTRRKEKVTGMLSDLGKYIRMAFESEGVMFVLGITSPDKRLEVAVLRRKAEEPWVAVTFPSDPEQERVLREFCTRKGLEIPKDIGTRPSGFSPNLPIQVFYRISPLPAEAAGVSALIEDFFRECGRLSNDAPLEFHIEEASDAA